MKADTIRSKLKKYLNGNDTIILEVIKGKPRSEEGGVWVETSVADMEKITESVDFDPVVTGWSKYLNKWATEGLITKKEKTTGKSS